MSAAKNIASATIANGASLSAKFSLGGASLCGVVMPAAWTAAALTFQVSLDGVTWGNLYDSSGVEYSVTASAGQYVAIAASDFYGIQYVKARSGTAGVPVNQTANAILQFVAVKLGDIR